MTVPPLKCFLLLCCWLKEVHIVLGPLPSRAECNWWFWASVPFRSVFVVAQYITFILCKSSTQRLIWLMAQWHIISMVSIVSRLLTVALVLAAPGILLTPGGEEFMVQRSGPRTVSGFMKLISELIEHCGSLMSNLSDIYILSWTTYFNRLLNISLTTLISSST